LKTQDSSVWATIASMIRENPDNNLGATFGEQVELLAIVLKSIDPAI